MERDDAQPLSYRANRQVEIVLEDDRHEEARLAASAEGAPEIGDQGGPGTPTVLPADAQVFADGGEQVPGDSRLDALAEGEPEHAELARRIAVVAAEHVPEVVNLQESLQQVSLVGIQGKTVRRPPAR